MSPLSLSRGSRGVDYFDRKRALPLTGHRTNRRRDLHYAGATRELNLYRPKAMRLAERLRREGPARWLLHRTPGDRSKPTFRNRNRARFAARNLRYLVFNSALYGYLASNERNRPPQCSVPDYPNDIVVDLGGNLILLNGNKTVVILKGLKDVRTRARLI